MPANLFSLCFVLCALFAGPVLARQTVPIVNHDNVAVATGHGQAVSPEQVRQAIQTAALSRSWSTAQSEPGKLLATLNVRNKHSIVVEISYSAEAFALRYKDSINMHYAMGQVRARNHDAGLSPEQPSIHPNYNHWVQALREAIRVELLKL